MEITIEQVYYEAIPTGKYPAKIKEIEEADGQFGPQLKFTFELQPDENGEHRTLLGWASKKFSNKSKLYAWTRAAMGGNTIDRSYTFKSGDLLGKYVHIVVVEEESDNGTINKIDKLLPYRPPVHQQPETEEYPF